MIAALFVETGGCYYGIDGVDPWDIQRDARKATWLLFVGPKPPELIWGPAEQRLPAKRLPNRRSGIRVTLSTGPNRLTLSTGEYPDGRLGEIFLDHQKEGTFGRDILNAFAMDVSLGLQHGITIETLAHSFRDFRMNDPEKAKVIRYLAERNAKIDARIAAIVKEQVDRALDSMELQMMGIKP